MYRELLSPNHKVKLPSAMGVLHAGALIIALVILSNALYNQFGIRWPGYVAYLIIGVIVVLLYKREVSQWVLEIGEDYIRFFSKGGNQEKLLVSIPIKSVDSLSLLPEGPVETPYERFCRLSGPQKPWLMRGRTEEGKDCRVVFCPSEEAVRALEERLDSHA